MPSIVTEIDIPRRIEDVFSFVTTPANWPLWHPSSLRVSAGADHPLTVGEAVQEDFVAAGQRGTVTWVVRSASPPGSWTIDCTPEMGGFAQITYQLTPAAGGTHFKRTLRYTMPSLWMRVLDALVLRWRLQTESATALWRLRDLLSSPAA
jgi:uncharacterized protein YndB with AHSA1/START domain